MIQNELLPGCAVLIDNEEVIYDGVPYEEIIGHEFEQFNGTKWEKYIKPIPLTAESVAKVEGCKRFDIIDNVDSFKFQAGLFNVVVYFFNDGQCEVFIDGKEIHHCKAIHSLQITIERLQGTMPKYNLS